MRRPVTLVTGAGEPTTVFAHGLAGGIPDTRPLGSNVAGRRVFFHFRGHGASDTPPGAWTYQDLAADLASVPAMPVAPVAGDGLTFQVASFAARGNAEHALAMLHGAGIGDARLLDADANGRRVWRLRVGPVAADAATELVARIQGLGFGQPQRVRE